MNAPDRKLAKPVFKWDDPFLLDLQLSEDERSELQALARRRKT